ncbi:hypothetical protein [Siansivirga zeaxanthinifaciens]|uniref:Uncharacterized protein n=1 Tax=Siansivirga zeaxanthinifaciens CC-SAMT-1 TaxID=1454006 RepID=A0A0C5WFG4_9FLAO|nr:hypothetical protein [Siansivirga zeaxanthinifaciens]AJR04937.1 hypothetical protein AW14_11610 [Siansivirga zeaxanthinifaciens CC-SAMT-1]
MKLLKLYFTLILTCLFLNLYSQSTWVDIAKAKSISEARTDIEVVLTTAHNLSYIRQNTSMVLIDIEKTYASAFVVKSVSPNTKLFEGQSFISKMRASIENNFEMNSKLGSEALVAGLDNATNSNGLLTSLINVHPVGAAVGNVLSIVNGFLEKKGVFLFIKKLFAPNYEKQIQAFEDDMAPYLNFYNSMDIHIENSIKTYDTYKSILASDGAKLESLFKQYLKTRNLFTGITNSTKQNLIDKINEIDIDNLTPIQYSSLYLDNNFKQLVHLSNEIKSAEISMSYNYLTFNKTALYHLVSWKNILLDNVLTQNNQSTDLKDIINTLENADIEITKQITQIEKLIKEREENQNNKLGEEILKMRINKGFFSPTNDFIEELKSNDTDIEKFINK